MNISILMVDDHLAILEGYELLLSYHPDKPTIKTKKLLRSKRRMNLSITNGNLNMLILQLLI
jgi:hypothetical protein